METTRAFFSRWPILAGALTLGVANPAPLLAQHARPPAAPDSALVDFKDYQRLVGGPHRLELHESGALGLETRLQMIEKANKSIDIETYIFKTDLSGCLVLAALVQKARDMKASGRPFSIRLLLDKQMMGPDVNEFFEHELAREGIQVRYYNRASVLNVPTVNRRNHKKTFMSDADTPNGELIIGGRNIADEYFDLHTTDNFVDLDVHVSGAAVGAVRDIFEKFWNSPQVSEGAPRPEKPRHSPASSHRDGGASAHVQSKTRAREWMKNVAYAKACLQPSAEKASLRKKIAAQAAIARRRVSPVSADKILVTSDAPDWKNSPAVAGAAILNAIRDAKSKVLIENPYFVPLDEHNELFARKLKEKVEVDVVVNSRSAFREFGMSSVALYRAKGLARMGGGAYLFKGAGAADRIAGFPYADKVRWATHSKAMVVDGRTSIVGSTNFDPRSLNRINSEIGLVVPDNPAFAHALEHSIQNRIRESVKIDGDGRDSTGKKVETPNYINVLQFMKVGGLELLEDQL